MIKLPPKLNLAHLPTPIEAVRGDYPAQLYIKRDDLAGMELSGNKVRKLEFVLKDALDQQADVIITCGAIQSNHARATAAAAAKLGLGCHLVLRHTGKRDYQGNLLLDQLFGATITTLTSDQFSDVDSYMAELVATYAQRGQRAYAIPVGASNAIGNLGYLNAFDEILADEQRLGLTFDVIVCTVGSGGTYAGLWLGNYLSAANRQIIGFNIADDAAYFKSHIAKIAGETLKNLGQNNALQPTDFQIIDGYVGRGYALSTAEELDFIRTFARQTGIVLDPVYTGKAMRGLLSSLPNRQLDLQHKRILFVHSGGVFSLFARAADMAGHTEV